MQEKRIKEKLVLKPVIKKKLIKCLWIILLLLTTMILIKKDNSLKVLLKENILEKSIPMVEARTIYDKYFNTITTNKEVAVFQEKIKWKKEVPTKTGVKLTVSSKSPIPILESGILVLVEDNKMIIEQVDGVTAIYEDLQGKDYKLYDYIEKGEILGETKDKEVQISFQKEGEYYDYKKYL